MQFKDGRRAYYDHEIQYKKIAAKGGVGWDSLSDDSSNDSYRGVEEFLKSSYASFLAEGRTALELGCGGGQVAMMFSRRGCVTFGIDFSTTAITLAKANAQKAGLFIDFREGNCLTLKDFEDRCMDVVIDNHVWHCIVGPHDRSAFLRAAHRVLKAGGLMFSESMTREGDFDPSVVGADPTTYISKYRNRYWPSREEALEELRRSGFAIINERLKAQPHEPGVGDLLITYCRRV